MSKQRLSLIVLLILQVVAVTIYPPVFFDTAPQAKVLPPIFLILLLVAVAAMNTGTIPPLSGQVFLAFVQGINLVVRLMMLFPHLRNAAGDWDFALLIIQLIGIALSWYTITQMQKLSPKSLLLRSQQA